MLTLGLQSKGTNLNGFKGQAILISSTLIQCKSLSFCKACSQSEHARVYLYIIGIWEAPAVIQKCILKLFLENRGVKHMARGRVVASQRIQCGLWDDIENCNFSIKVNSILNLSTGWNPFGHNFSAFFNVYILYIYKVAYDI